MITLKKASFEAIKYACLKFHYAHSIPGNPFGYTVFNGDIFCGCIVFGVGANHRIASPYKLVQGQVIELVRVALNGHQGQTSKAVSIALKLIKKDVPTAKLIISYADLDQGHIGVIYQATNWYYEGLFGKKTRSAFLIKGKKIHQKTVWKQVSKHGLRTTLEHVKKVYGEDSTEFYSKGKHKYLYPLSVDMIQLCRERSKPFPKSILS